MAPRISKIHVYFVLGRFSEGVRNYCVYVTGGTSVCKNHAEESLLPVNTWGTIIYYFLDSWIAGHTVEVMTDFVTVLCQEISFTLPAYILAAYV